MELDNNNNNSSNNNSSRTTNSFKEITGYESPETEIPTSPKLEGFGTKDLTFLLQQQPQPQPPPAIQGQVRMIPGQAQGNPGYTRIPTTISTPPTTNTNIPNAIPHSVPTQQLQQQPQQPQQQTTGVVNAGHQNYFKRQQQLLKLTHQNQTQLPQFPLSSPQQQFTEPQITNTRIARVIGPLLQPIMPIQEGITAVFPLVPQTTAQQMQSRNTFYLNKLQQLNQVQTQIIKYNQARAQTNQQRQVLSTNVQQAPFQQALIQGNAKYQAPFPTTGEPKKDYPLIRSTDTPQIIKEYRIPNPIQQTGTNQMQYLTQQSSGVKQMQIIQQPKAHLQMKNTPNIQGAQQQQTQAQVQYQTAIKSAPSGAPRMQQSRQHVAVKSAPNGGVNKGPTNKH